MLARQTQNRALQPQYAILNPLEYQKKNTPKEGERKSFVNFEKTFVHLKSNLALLNNKGHNFWKSVSTWKIPQNWIFPY